MLIKLMKYDFKAMFRNMAPSFLAMFVLSIVCSFLTRIKLTNNTIFTLLIILSMFVFVGASVLTVVLVVKRFVDSLLNNEGYFNFSLPVTTMSHIIAKVINALIWGILLSIALFICFLISFIITGNLKDLIRAFEFIVRIDITDCVYLFRILSLLALSITCLICKVYASYSVGHLFKRHTTALAIAAFVIFTIIEVTFNPITSIIKLPSTDITNISFYLLHLVAIIGIIIYFFITWYILDRHLNLD